MGDDLNNVEDQTSIGNIWQIRTNKYRICTELSQGIFFVVFEIAAELPCCRGAAESPIDATYPSRNLPS